MNSDTPHLFYGTVGYAKHYIRSPGFPTGKHSLLLFRTEDHGSGEFSEELAATLCGSWPGVQSASPKTPKNTSFF